MGASRVVSSVLTICGLIRSVKNREPGSATVEPEGFTCTGMTAVPPAPAHAASIMRSARTAVLTQYPCYSIGTRAT